MLENQSLESDHSKGFKRFKHTQKRSRHILQVRADIKFSDSRHNSVWKKFGLSIIEFSNSRESSSGSKFGLNGSLRVLEVCGDSDSESDEDDHDASESSELVSNALIRILCLKTSL